jgi:hypothetical protein
VNPSALSGPFEQAIGLKGGQIESWQRRRQERPLCPRRLFRSSSGIAMALRTDEVEVLAPVASQHYRSASRGALDCRTGARIQALPVSTKASHPELVIEVPR